ncbi:MAG: DUF2341 domain-containing protein, partial [Vicingaceae bacterium]|nr:DUF2341 domain-containing protein [Vicingaceae bacterium]
MKKIFTILSLTFLSFVSTNAYSQMTGWSHYSSFTVTSSIATDQFDKQFIININTVCPIESGLMLQNGDDIRIGKDQNGTQLIGHYIVKGINTSSTDILIEVDTLLASATNTYYLFYGNPTATNGTSLTFMDGPHSATDSVVSPNTNNIVANHTRGFNFSTNQDIFVPVIGYRVPTTGSQYHLSIWDQTNQNILTQFVVPSSVSATYTYHTLDSALILNTGTTYICTQHGDANAGYYFGTSTQIGNHLNYGGQMRHASNATPTTFPSNSLANYHYGNPDFHYYLYNELSATTTGISSSLVTSTFDPNYCYDESIVINGVTYDNSNPSGTETINLAGINSCDSIINVNITFETAIDVSTSSTFNTATAALNGASYQWIDCNNNNDSVIGATSQSYTATVNSNYAVILTVGNCSDTSACVNLSPVGISNNSIESNITIFPNPTEGIVVVNLDENSRATSYTVSSVEGKIITQETNITNNTLTIDLNSESKGIY